MQYKRNFTVCHFRLRGLEVRKHEDFSLFEHNDGEECHVLFLTLRLEQVNNLPALKHKICLCWREEIDGFHVMCGVRWLMENPVDF